MLQIKMCDIIVTAAMVLINAMEAQSQFKDNAHRPHEYKFPLTLPCISNLIEGTS